MIRSLNRLICIFSFFCWANAHYFNRQNHNSSTASNPVCLCHSATDLLNFNYNSTTNLVEISNRTAQTALIFDSKNNLTAIVSIKRRVVIIIDIEAESGIYYKSSDILRHFLKNGTSFRVLKERDRRSGISFNIYSTSPKVSRVINSVLQSLNGQCSSLHQLLRLSKILRSALSSDLHRILPSLRTPISTGYQELIVRLKFLSEGNITNFIISNRIVLNFANILFESRGIRVLIYLLQEFSRGDIRQVLSSSLNSTESFLHLIWILEGKTSSCVGGLLRVLLQIVLLAHGRGSIQNVTNALVHYFGDSDKNNSSVGQELLSSFGELRNAIQGVALKRIFPSLAKLLDDIRNRRWIENGVNLTPLLTDSRGATYPIINVLFSLRRITPIQTSVVQLFAQYIFLVNSTEGIRSLSRLIPGIINSQIQDNLTFAELFAIIPGGFLRFLLIFECGTELGLQFKATFWRMLPFIGDIFAFFDTATRSILHRTFGNFLENANSRPIIEEMASFLRQLSNSYLQPSDKPGLINAGILPVSNITTLANSIPQGIHTFQQLIQDLPFSSSFSSNNLRCPNFPGGGNKPFSGLVLNGSGFHLNLPLPFMGRRLHAKKRTHHSQGRDK